jgi:hypothetical protein
MYCAYVYTLGSKLCEEQLCKADTNTSKIQVSVS